MAEITNQLIYEVLKDVQKQTAEVKSTVAEHSVQLTELRSQIAVLAQGQNAIRNDVGQIKLHLQEIAIIIDHHGRRLDEIEGHMGLDKAKH